MLKLAWGSLFAGSENHLKMVPKTQGPGEIWDQCIFMAFEKTGTQKKVEKKEERGD